jgi:hypothetical protein
MWPAFSLVLLADGKISNIKRNELMLMMKTSGGAPKTDIPARNLFDKIVK